MAIRSDKTIGHSFVELPEVESTNNYAMHQLQSGKASHGTCYFAHKQTAGKGQRNRHWISEPRKNLLMSVLINTSGFSVSNIFVVSVMIAAAAHELFQGLAKNSTFIKWPNDIYCGDRKAGGILIENVIRGKEWHFAVAGIGLNINQTIFPKDAVNAISLQQITGMEFDVIALAKELCNFIQMRYEQLQKGGFKELLEYYNAVLYKQGEVVQLKKGPIVCSCTIEKVNEYGQLMVKGAANDVFNFGEVEWIMA